MSDYSTVGNTQTYAAGLGWEPVDSLRIRTQYNRAVRAPNVGDLFSPATNGFPGATDPCSGGLGSYDAGVIAANCIASGVPAAAVGTPFQSNAQIEALFGGNANVDEETADTFTIGAVWQPNFISGFTMQVDYYNIEIEDAIATPSLQNLLDECYRQDIQSACAFFAGVVTRAPVKWPIRSCRNCSLRTSLCSKLKASTSALTTCGMPSKWACRPTSAPSR